MSIFTELDVYAHRRSRWPALLQGERLFTELRALHPDDLPEAIRILEKCSIDPSLKFHIDQQASLRAVTTCAQMAALDSFNATRLPTLLRLIDPDVSLPEGFQAGLARVSKEQLPQTLRAALQYAVWQPPLCPAWGWDAINRFWKSERRVDNSQHATLLLVDGKGQGVVADLSLELLGGGCGEIYPHPGLMWHPLQRPAFQEAIEHANGWVSSYGIWPAKHDIRWSITRQDGGPLDVLEGGSAGAAFALAMARLVATFA